jgi:hypothetical protein
LIAGWLRIRPPRHNVIVYRGIEVPTPDGSFLAADHYAPASGGRLYPTILIRTPYGRSLSSGPTGFGTSFAARRFAERGYNVVVQDVRGRYDSPGEFMPFYNEATDGCATLDWLEAQPWFNGVLGMWGPSYLGYVQWALATNAPIYLKALMPVVSGSELAILGIRDGALAADMLLRWVYELETTQRRGGMWAWLRQAGLDHWVLERAIRRVAKTLPVGQMDLAAVGRKIPFFQAWVNHSSPDDPYWKPVLHQDQLASVTAAVNFVSGWHDILLRETLADYTMLKSAGRTPYLTIGPWAHNDLSLESEALRQGLIWFDAHLKGDPSGLRKSPVRIYIMGEGRWVEMDSWPPPSRKATYYLDGGGSLASNPPKSTMEDHFTYDPANPTPALGGALMSRHAGAHDNRPLEARKDVLTYTTPPLESDLEIIGSAQVVLIIQSSLPHTDLFARLCDVCPDGPSLNVCDGFIRISPGSGNLQLDGSLRIIIDLWPTAYCWRRGHCLRLQISSGAHPRWTRNTGSGESLATAVRLFPAEQTIHHDLEHPSVLILPVTSN